MIGEILVNSTRKVGRSIQFIFKKKETTKYPEERRVIEERFRAAQILSLESCIGCGLCARACPVNAIEIKKEKNEENPKKPKVEMRINLGRCIFCALCIDACPKKCIRMGHNFETSTYDIRSVENYNPAGGDEK